MKQTFVINLIDAPASTMKAVLHYLNGLDPTKPWRITIEPYKADRSAAQNRLSHKWYGEIAKQRTDDTQEWWRGYCKLTKGVPILRAENEEFREIYDRVIRPLSYGDKLKLMSPPIDIPITSIMNVHQFSQYLDDVQRHFAQEGVILSSGDDLYQEAMGRRRK